MGACCPLHHHLRQHRPDQCGIVMYLNSDNWLKGSVEYENDEFQHLSSVVTNNGYSDWATTAIPADVKTMWHRFSRREDDYCIECSVDGQTISQMRVCHMYAGANEISFGIYACSPEEASFTAVFSDMKITECAWKAHDGQQPFEKMKRLDAVIDRINKVNGTETIVLGSQQYTQKDGKGKANVFANAIKHDFKSKNPTYFTSTSPLLLYSSKKMETERLLLRPWQDGDAEMLFKYASDPDVGPRAGWPPHKSVEESLGIIQTVFRSEGMWAVIWKESGEAIGCVGFLPASSSNLKIAENHAEVGYWIARPYWGKGICTEALQMVIDYCFSEKGFTVLWGDYFPSNPASGRVMEKCGFLDTGEETLCPNLEVGADRLVKVMKLEKTR